MEYSREKILALRDLVYQKFGIKITQEKLPRFELKLSKMLQDEGFSNFDELYNYIDSGKRDNLNRLVEYITTCHTFFFRESEHFDDLILYIKKHPHSFHRIWCSACSTGEEPYSIVITLLEEGIRNFHIIATDLNKNVLKIFNKGVYHENRLSETPVNIRLKYFKPFKEGYYKINDNLRNYISIKQLNLMEPIKFPDLVDFIFCRNVFIYFDDDSRKKAIDTLVGNLKINGILFLGHAEVLLYQPENLIKMGASIYRRI